MVLGIDPGTATVGFSFVSGTGQDPVIHDFGVLTTQARDKEFMPERLLELGLDLEKLIKKFKPIKAVVEDIFFFKNLKTAVSVAQSRGMILYILAKSNVKVISVTPLQVKQTVCGYGRATKKEIQDMVVKIYDLDSVPKPDDAADSLAMAWMGL
jgi:crossover junction endodeoxyribonuclease RuvC